MTASANASYIYHLTCMLCNKKIMDENKYKNHKRYLKNAIKYKNHLKCIIDILEKEENIDTKTLNNIQKELDTIIRLISNLSD